MRVIIFAIIVNTVVCVANIIYMNHISREAYSNLKRFASFKCLSDEFEKYSNKPNKISVFTSCLLFIVPIVNVITLFISCFDYDDMVKDVQKTTADEFMTWVENNK